MNEMRAIRDAYHVPAKRGMRVRFTYHPQREGVITGARFGRLRVRFDGERVSRSLHPTWEVLYPCRRCAGTGRVVGMLTPYSPCPDCDGTGRHNPIVSPYRGRIGR